VQLSRIRRGLLSICGHRKIFVRAAPAFPRWGWNTRGPAHEQLVTERQPRLWLRRIGDICSRGFDSLLRRAVIGARFCKLARVPGAKRAWCLSEDKRSEFRWRFVRGPFREPWGRRLLRIVLASRYLEIPAERFPGQRRRQPYFFAHAW